MSEESIIKKVASAIWRQRVETAAKNGVDLSKDDEEFMIAANSIVDEARAAVQAYEAAKREAEKPYIIRALNPFDEERMRPREDKLNWERPE